MTSENAAEPKAVEPSKTELFPTCPAVGVVGVTDR
jgi:hypothetical protein